MAFYTPVPILHTYLLKMPPHLHFKGFSHVQHFNLFPANLPFFYHYLQERVVQTQTNTHNWVSTYVWSECYSLSQYPMPIFNVTSDNLHVCRNSNLNLDFRSHLSLHYYSFSLQFYFISSARP